MRRGTQMLAVGVAVLMMASCVGETEDPDPTDPAVSSAEHTLTPVNSCSEVQVHIADSLTEKALDRQYGNQYWGMNGEPVADDAESAPDSGGADSGESSDGPDDTTDTNIQEEGVDEPDIVKTGDGTHIYTVVDGSLQVLKSWPPEETELIGEAEFASEVTPDSMFLEGDRVVVLSRQNQTYYGEPEPTNGSESSTNDTEPDDQTDEPDFGGTRVSMFDVSDPENPELSREIALEGRQVDARMVDGEIFLVTNSNLRELDLYDLIDWNDQDLQEKLPDREGGESEEKLEEMRETARPILKDYLLDEVQQTDPGEWLPRQRIGEDGDIEQMYDCTDLYLPNVQAELGVLNVSSIDVEENAQLDSTGLVASGWQIYASQTNLYVGMSSRTWWWGPWGAGDQENESFIHQFKLNGEDEPKYMASGRVDGWILDQFSFSEHQNHLRVATTDNRWQWNDGEAEQEGGNHMIVLKREGGELVETGSVRDLAPGERIYSTRFMGDRGFMVTFRRVDPFYTFDLSNPNDPEMLGELKIQGFSSYMHPIDENHLLAIGRDGEDDGTITGVHVQIFDVSDMENPERIHHETVSTGSWSSGSEANHDHHAFTYQKEKGILAIPLSVYENGDYFNGLILFEATPEEGIEEIGRIDHSGLISEWWCQENQPDADDCSYDPTDNYYGWRSRMRRSIMMTGETDDEYLYSLSDVGMRVNDVNDLDEEFSSVLLRD